MPTPATISGFSSRLSILLCGALALGGTACAVLGHQSDDPSESNGTGGVPSGAGATGGLGGRSGAGGMLATGGASGIGGITGAGGASAGGGASGTAGITGAGAGGTTGTGGRPGVGGTTGGATGGSPGAAGASGVCNAASVSTATRPLLTAAAAANDTILNYLAQAGTLGALTTDNWNPTAGLGSPTAFPADLVVAADGSGTNTTVQAALNAATGTTRRYIQIKPGTYRGAVSSSSATPVTLYGTGAATQVVIVNGLSSTAAGGTAQSATFSARANNLQLMNLTISNDFATPVTGDNIQAVALHTIGDKIVMQNVRLHGFQDTLYIDSAAATTVARVYIKGSFIEGDTDFIFGRSTAVIDGSTINYLSSRKGTGTGVHLAPSTSVANNYGFLVINSAFTADASAPANRISLGRSWDQSSTVPTPNGQAVIRESTLGAHINRTAPWAAAATSSRAFSATGNRFFEYCNNGPGAAP